MEWLAAAVLGWILVRGPRKDTASTNHSREREVILIVGAPGSGKTAVARTLYGRAMSRGAATVVYDPNDPTRGIWPGGDKLDDDLATRLRDRSVELVVMDDCDKHLRRWTTSVEGPWRDLALRHRHLGVDVILTARSTEELPPELLSSVHWLYVFRVGALDRGLLKRVGEVAPGVTLPKERHRFVAIDMNAEYPPVHGRTLAGGGYELDA